MYIYLSALYSNFPVISLLQLKFEIFDLIGIFEHVFDQLKVNPSKHKVGYWSDVQFVVYFARLDSIFWYTSTVMTVICL